MYPVLLTDYIFLVFLLSFEKWQTFPIYLSYNLNIRGGEQLFFFRAGISRYWIKGIDQNNSVPSPTETPPVKHYLQLMKKWIFLWFCSLQITAIQVNLMCDWPTTFKTMDILQPVASDDNKYIKYRRMFSENLGGQKGIDSISVLVLVS